MPMAGGGSGGGGSSVIDAGRAAVKLGADKAGLKSDLAAASRMVMGWGKSIATVGGGLLGVGGSLLGGISGAFKSAVDKFDSVKEAADRLGTSTETISELGYAAEKAGAGLAEMEAGGKFLNKNLALNADAFEQFGIDAEKLKGMELGQQFEVIADALAGMNKEMATGAATTLLGKSGDKLLPLLKKGSAELRAQRQIARDVGASINGIDAANADRAADAMHDSWEAVKNTFLAVGAALLPQVSRLEMLRNVIVSSIGSVREFINDNREMVLGITIGAAVVAAAGVALIALGGSLAIASFAIGGFTTAWAAMTAVMAASVSVPALVIVGIAAAAATIAALVLDFEQLDAIGQNIAGVFAPLGETISQTFKGVSAAIKANDWGLAFDVTVAGMDVTWQLFMAGIQKAWSNQKLNWIDTMDFFGDGWDSLMRLMGSAFDSVMDSVEDGLADLGHSFMDAVMGILGLLQKAMKSVYLIGGKTLVGKAINSVNPLGQIGDMEALRKEAEEKFKKGTDKENAKRDKRDKKFNDELQAARDAREAARQAVADADMAGVEAAVKKLIEAQAKLDAKVKEAEGLGGAEKVGQLGPMPREVKDNIVQALTELGSSRGGFGSSNASARFGVGNVQEKQLRELEGIHREVKKKGGGIPVE